MKISKERLQILIKEELSKTLKEVDMEDMEEGGTGKFIDPFDFSLQNSPLGSLVGKEIPFLGANPENHTFKLGDKIYKCVIGDVDDYSRDALERVEEAPDDQTLSNTEPLDMVKVVPTNKGVIGFRLVSTTSGFPWLTVGTHDDFYPRFVFNFKQKRGSENYPTDVGDMKSAESDRFYSNASARQKAARAGLSKDQRKGNPAYAQNPDVVASKFGLEESKKLRRIVAEELQKVLSKSRNK